jgi:NADPH:quinone reductase-like Zn-dependent oxidoreductase
MRAIVNTRNGPPEVLELIEIAKPSTKDNEVLIKIFATTVTAGDVLMRKLKFPLSFIFWLYARIKYGSIISRKNMLGHEFSGEIEAVGNCSKKVTKFMALLGWQGGLMLSILYYQKMQC